MIRCFRNAQIHASAPNKQLEYISDSTGVHCLEQGKNHERLASLAAGVVETKPATHHRKGQYFYLWSKPLVNYYHTILDGGGCLTRYFAAVEQHGPMTLLVNSTPRMGLDSYPPFVAELFELLGIRAWELADPAATYETVYFGDTGNQDANHKRITPSTAWWKLIAQLVHASSTVSAPQHDKIYLSRRAHANPLVDRKTVIGEDNTVKRGLINEDAVVDIVTGLGYTEVFGENYTLAQKIRMFSGMHKYITAAGAGVTNGIWVRDHILSHGGIHTPGFPHPGPRHSRHMLTASMSNARISVYPGRVSYHDPATTSGTNHPWQINNLAAFSEWAATV